MLLQKHLLPYFLNSVLRKDLINELIEAPGSSENNEAEEMFYDGPFDFTFFRRDHQNIPKHIFQVASYGQSRSNGTYLRCRISTLLSEVNISFV